ncbi:DUF3313 family protein [Roseateles sp.]|uniref:DUF3313 family protein n=1 Tax=Roseateles sp. TaxID=1971397 RepID=UPI003BA6B607
MKISSRSTGAAVLISLSMLMSNAFATQVGKEVEARMSHDGLQQIKLKEVDLAYARPGASLAGYSKVILDPVEVSFSKYWDPKRTGSNFKLSNEEREDIRSGMATIVQEEFAKTLQAKDGYPLVKEAGPDVLRVKVSIIDLYVNAPDTLAAVRTRTYVASAGEATLVAELRDSETGQVLARMVDRREARNFPGQLTWSNRVMNAQEAEIMASAWAKVLRKSLDKAHEIGKK